MPLQLDARNLSLEDVHYLLNFEQQLNDFFASLLSLEPLTEFEQQEIKKIRDVFWNYYAGFKFTEGEVKLLLLAPLLWLSGFYSSSIKITLEEGISDISVEDEDTLIKGRLDILAATKSRDATTALWILVIESKRKRFDALEGLPQLLTYAYSSLERQESVWGLTTNGMDYSFVYMQQGNSPSYQLFPKLSLIRPDNSVQLLQVMKAICKPYL